MRKLHFLFLLALLGALVACGNKGDLVKPDGTPQKKKTSALVESADVTIAKR